MKILYYDMSMAYNYTNAPYYPSLISAVNNVYDLNSLNIPYSTISVNVGDTNTVTAYSGNVNTNGIIGTLTNGTSNNAYAFIQSSPIKFIQGEFTRARIGAVFSTGVANTTQFAGLIDNNNGVAFGYQGNTFGILSRSGGISETRQLVIANAATTTGNVILTLDGTAFNVPVTAGDSVRTVTKKINTAKQDTWNSTDLGNAVLFSSYTSGPRSNAYSVGGTTGVVGTLTSVTAGNVGTVGWIPQTSWAIDPANDTQSLPTLDPTKPQVYGISFQNSGYGAATFHIQSPRDARFYPVHRLTLSGNTATSQPLVNTETLPLRVQTQTAGGVGSNMTVTSLNMQVDVYNPTPIDQLTGPRYTVATFTSNYTVRKNLQNHMMSLLNNFIVPYTGVANYSDVQLVSVSVSFDGVGSLQVLMYKNATLSDPSVYTPGATISFTSTASNSLSSYYKSTSCDVTGGTLVKYLGVVKGNSVVDNVQQQFIVLSPGDLLTFAVQNVDPVNSVGSDITISCVFCEKT